MTETNEQSTAIGDTAFLRALLNVVIPPDGRMPGAGDLDLWPAVAGPLSQNAGAAALIAAGLEAISQAALERDSGGLAALPPAAALEVVQTAAANYPLLMPALVRMTMMAYYQHPAVLVALGEPARPPFPEGFELEPISPDWLTRLEQRAQGKPAIP